MIYVFDNGMSYSDHTITFISTDGYDEDDAELILRRVFQFGDEPYDPDYPDNGHDRSFLIAKVEKIEWYAGTPHPLSGAYHWRYLLSDFPKHFDLLKTHTVDKLYSEWLKEIDKQSERHKELYAKHPQPKLAAQIAEDHLKRDERDRKLLTEAMEAYWEHRRGLVKAGGEQSSGEDSEAPK